MEAESALGEIEKNCVIILGYPTQYSNAPYMVRDFINRNRNVWKDKKILCVATMGLFSGDGAGCGLCVSLCPMKNISIQGDRAVGGDRCTMCYRCISHCPQKAITLLEDQVIGQCRFETYCQETSGSAHLPFASLERNFVAENTPKE